MSKESIASEEVRLNLPFLLKLPRILNFLKIGRRRVPIKVGVGVGVGAGVHPIKVGVGVGVGVHPIKVGVGVHPIKA